MNLDKIYLEEDLFPREFAWYMEREYGLLFYDETNKDSYDSNHAIIFKEKIDDLSAVLQDITRFYREKGINPSIYQSITDDGYFAANKDVFAKHGFKVWEEEQRYMLLTEENVICSNPKVTVKRVAKWEEIFATEIFEKAEEPWEIEVARKVLKRENTIFFAAYFEGNPVGMMYGHVRDGVCRVDYLLVSKEHRNIGVARTLVHAFVNDCREQGIENCFLWPAGESAERIYVEAGFRPVAMKQAGRAAVKV